MDDPPRHFGGTSEQKRISYVVGALADADVVDLVDSLCAALADTTSPEFVASIRTVPLRDIRHWLTSIALDLERRRR